MIKNYLKTALRNLWKSRTYSTINILGLAVGLASFLVILLYLNHELNYDKWDDSLKRVYKISLRSDAEILDLTPAPLASFLRDNTPQITAATSIMPAGSFEILMAAGEKQIFQAGSVTADSSFFKVFPYKFVQGNAATALDKPNAMVISQDLASKLFGRANPIGQTVKVYNAFDCEVTGVMQQPATPTQLDVQVVYRAPYEKSNQFWTNYSYETYVKTRQFVPVNELEKVVDQIYYDLQVKKGKESLSGFRKAGHQAGLFVDAMQDLHNFPKHGDSNFKTVSMLLVLASLLLLAGAVNFSNLSIASSIRRAREVGVRKVLGSSRKQLFGQFLGETGLQCLLSLGVGLLLTLIILPYFKKEFHIVLGFTLGGSGRSIALQVAGTLLAVILLSGIYPAFFLSRFNTAKVLKGDYSSSTKATSFRNMLIVLQFTFSAIFVIAAVVIGRQMHFMQSADKGFSGQQVMRIQTTQKTRDTDFETVRHTLLGLTGVEEVSKTTAVPGDILSDSSTYAFKYEDRSYRMASVKVSSEYFSTLRIPLLKGRMFSDRYADQHTRSVIVNESAMHKLNLADPIGASISFDGCDSIPMQIVGVVKDFHVAGFENTVLPVVYTIGNEACMFQSGGGMLVRIGGNDLKPAVKAIEKAWKGIEPGFPIRYSFLDDNFQQLFASYVRLQRIIDFFGLIAISISLMGLFALTAFLVGQRRKEIGIRKVLGAGLADLGMLLSKDFIRLVCIAVLLAIPLGWWAAKNWLQGFAYHITLNGWMFLGAALMVVALAALTVALQVWRASSANPADSLRDE